MEEFTEKYINRDLKNSLDTARGEGKIEGKFEIAIKALKKGISISDIIELTGLSEDEIKGINQ